MKAFLLRLEVPFVCLCPSRFSASHESIGRCDRGDKAAVAPTTRFLVVCLAVLPKDEVM